MTKGRLLVPAARKHLLALAKLFEDRGDVVITAGSLNEAGNVVRRYKPDLILLDVQRLGENLAAAAPTMERGVDHLESHKGVHFDPTVVGEFIRMIQINGVDGNKGRRTLPVNSTLLRKTVPFG